jgi:PleD family two-component response regulator
MLEHLNLSPEENVRSLKLILLIVNHAKVGPFLVRVIKKETRHHVMLASHEHQAFKVIQEIKPDLLLLDFELVWKDGFQLYERLHATEGLKHVPVILSDISTRFVCHSLRKQYLRSGEKSSELEDFLHTIQEVLA